MSLAFSHCIARSPRRESRKLSAHECIAPLETKYAAVSKKARIKKKKYSRELKNLLIKELVFWAKNAGFKKSVKLFHFCVDEMTTFVILLI
jgi:hypothetical protein